MDDKDKFLQACEDNRHDVVDSMLENGYIPPPESIIKPCELGYLDMVIKLLKYPMMLQEGFYEAIYGCCVPLLDHLYFNGVDINHKYINGDTALHIAANRKVIKWLMDMGAQHLPNDYGLYPLTRACRENLVAADEFVRCPQLPDNDGCTPLHYACYYSDIKVVKLLLDHGGQQLSDDDGETPLHLTCRNKPRLVMEQGQLVCRDNKIELVALLLSQGGQQLPDNDGDTPLHNACRSENIELVTLLLSHGGQLLANKNGDTPLDLARKSHNHELTKLLEQYQN